MTKRCVVTALVAAVTAVVAGCSSLDLGPEPSNFVGQSDRAPVTLTDPNLNAVTPIVTPAESPAVSYPPASMPGEGATPGTMPAATQPNTTQPTASTNPTQHVGLGRGAASQPTPTRNALGRVDVPAELDIQNAILVGLQNNVSLRVDRLNVPITRTNEELQRAAFDPTVSGQISGGRTVTNTGTTSSRGPSVTTDSLNATASISQFLPTGTTVTGSITSNSTFYSDSGSNLDAGISVTQSLLRGAGLDVNLASLRSAELQTKITQFQLRGFAEDLVANIEETYWDLAFAERQVVIVENALNVAQEQLDSTNASIRVGRVAPTERAAAEAQVAFEKEQLISAKSTLETTRIRFLQLITPAGEPFWNRTVTLQVQPFVPVGEMDPVDKHADVAMRLRPEINETKLQIQQNDLTVVQTKNGLLPQLDFFVNLDKTSFSESFGNTFSGLNSPDYSAIAGIKLESYDVTNRDQIAKYHSSILTREQTQESLRNLEQTVQIDVRTAYISVETARQQIDATRATREANEISLQVETAKFKAGRSTSLLVAQAQQTLLTSQLAEVQAVIAHLKSLVELYRLEGSLLYRRGVDAPGGKPVLGREWH